MAQPLLLSNLHVRPLWQPGSRWLLFSMVGAVAAVGTLASLDEARESAATLDDFGNTQAILAQSVASELAFRLEIISRDARRLADGSSVADLGDRYLSAAIHHASEPALPPAVDGRALQVSMPLPDDRRVDFNVTTAWLFSGASRLERSNSLSMWFLPPGSEALTSTDGRRLGSPPLVAALQGGGSFLRLGRQDAEQLSLPPRMALGGLAHVDAGALGRWGVAVVATAERERNRQARARTRLLLALILAGGLVLAFGGFALRKQRQELSLAQELAVAAVARDRDERLARLSRAATTMTLASGMAHELSTPLGVIVGRAEQLEARLADDEKARRSVQTILEQADRISQVLRGFLNLARGGPPSLQSVDPASIVRAALGLVEHRFEKRGVFLEMTIPEGLAPIRCDPRLLEQALVNLLLNACDACPLGGHVLVGAHADGVGLSFTVTDNGAGISPEHAARITEPFFTTKPKGEGTGLGLAITNEIVKSHRGSLSITSAQPHGTCATLQIPFARGEPDARA